MASLTAYQLNEWIAYAGIEPFGALHDEFIGGQLCATVANYAGMQRAESAGPAMASDFMPALNDGTPRRPVKPEAVLLDDPEEQSRLIKSSLFGIKI